MQIVSVKNTELGRLGELLAASRARIAAAATSVPFQRSPAFRYNLTALQERQLELERVYARALAEQRGENLGFWPAVGIFAGSALLTWLGASVYKQHQETAEVEGRMEIYDQLLAAGYSPEDAGKLAFGDSGGIGDVLDKLILISAIGAGILVFLKLKK